MLHYTIQNYDFNTEEKGTISAREFKEICKNYPWAQKHIEASELENNKEESCPTNLCLSNGKYNLMVMSNNGKDFQIMAHLPKSILMNIVSYIFHMVSFEKEFDTDIQGLFDSVDAFSESNWAFFKTI